MTFSLSPSAPDNLVSRDEFGSPVSRIISVDTPKVFPRALLHVGLTGGTVTSVFRFLGVPLVGAETGGCTLF